MEEVIPQIRKFAGIHGSPAGEAGTSVIKITDQRKISSVSYLTDMEESTLAVINTAVNLAQIVSHKWLQPNA